MLQSKYADEDELEYTHPEHSERIIQDYPTVRIAVFLEGHSTPMVPMLEGASYAHQPIYVADNPNNIYLLVDQPSLTCIQKHWFGLYNLCAYLRNAVYRGKKLAYKQLCHECFQMFRTTNNRKNARIHVCKAIRCLLCGFIASTKGDLQEHQKTGPQGKVQCVQCYLMYPNQVCATLHSKSCRGNTVRCNTCLDVLSANQHRSEHRCNGRYLCHLCAKSVDRDHVCYMRVNDKMDLSNILNISEETITTELVRFYVFDFESSFTKGAPIRQRQPDGTYLSIEPDVHTVNFIAVRQCHTGTEWQFPDLAAFCAWMKDHEEPGVLLAHNMKGYDGRMLFDHLLSIGDPPGECVWVGSKIMAMAWQEWKIRDTLTHCTFPLDNMTAVFGLDPNQFAKGYFPYKFNVPANRDYVGPLPALQYYEPDMMSLAKRTKFLKWYNEEKETLGAHGYVFWDQLVTYCLSDVRLLAKAMEVYMREGMLTNHGLNPLGSVTIASYALRVYRQLHMPEETLVHLSPAEESMARRALHGGRTDVRQMVKFWSEQDVREGRYGCYQDVQSLYPTVQFYRDMPTGKPTILTFGDDHQPTKREIAKWFGFVRCDLSVESEQFHPVIVAKDKTGKLVADLNDKTDVVLTTPEFFAALANGYELVKVHEVHLYTPSKDLFKSYIRTFLKIKIEAGGMPKHVRTDEDWLEFAAYHEEQLGITLDRHNMIKNAGKKQLAKLMLNSLWGKFAERKHWGNYVKLDARKDWDKFQALETRWDRGEIDIQYRQTFNDHSMLMIYREDPKFVNVTNQDSYINLAANVAVASFVTAWGALTLWQQMKELDDRVLYHDTDSIIYERDPYGYNIPLGKYLGEWEDETSGEPMIAFVSTGPKTYAYKVRGKAEPFDEEQVDEWVRDGVEYVLSNNGQSMYPVKHVCKAKGFTLNAHNSGRINFNTMHELLLGNCERLEASSLKFVYRRGESMVTIPEKKSMTFNYTKGHVDDQFKVWPHGFQRFRTYEGPRRGWVSDDQH
jgi:hypothetical protein